MSCLDLDDEAILKVADPMMVDTIEGIARRDHALHSRHFSVALKSEIGPDRFLADCDQREADWGRPEGRELICILRKPRSFTLVWEQGFDRAEGQVLAVLTIALKGGRYFVDHLLLH